jgi:hypothetical protein
MRNTAQLTAILLCASLSTVSVTASPQTDSELFETIKLTAQDGEAEEYLGYSVALHDGRALVGAFRDDELHESAGAAYIFDIETGAQLLKLLPDSSGENHLFGSAVALRGDIALVSSVAPNPNGTGAVLIFDATSGLQLGELLPSNGETGALFGVSISMTDTHALVGSFQDNDPNNITGAAYLFELATGAQVWKLMPDDGHDIDLFGFSVALSDERAVIGAPFSDNPAAGPESGAAYLFDTQTGAQLTKMLPSDASWGGHFGYSVALHEDVMAIGSANAERAYIFEAETGTEKFRLLPPHPGVGDLFGFGLGVSERGVVVGAREHEHDGMDTGAAYLYDNNTGALLKELLASDGSDIAYLGQAIAVDGSDVVMGAMGQTNGADPSVFGVGAAYVFDIKLQPGVPFCFATPETCPCNNSFGIAQGCANSSCQGAVLRGSGSDSVSADDLSLTATGLTTGPGLFFQGNNTVNGGAGVAFGDGLRCVGGRIKRLQVRFSTFGESSSTISIATRGEVIVGDTKFYQYWYRDPNVWICDNGFNTTNGYEVTWTP